jgi:hypothetical protein
MPKGYRNCKGSERVGSSQDVERTQEAVRAGASEPGVRSGTNGRLKCVGMFGLKNKKEVWRVQYLLAKIRKAARELLILPENDPKRLFEGREAE